MSVEHLAIVLHHSQATGTDKLVLVGIANHAGDGGAWPSVDTLARYANTTERTVQRSLRTLVELGEVERHVQAGGLPGWDDSTRPNRYDVLVTCPAWCDRTPHHRPAPGWAYDKALRTVVQVDQLPLSTGDTPEMQNTATRRIDRVTPTSPGDAHVTPPGDAHVTQTIQVTQPSSTPVCDLPTDRASTAASVRPQLDAVRSQLATASTQYRQRERGAKA